MPLTDDERSLVVELCRQIGSCVAAVISFAINDSQKNEDAVIKEFGTLGSHIADIMEED